MAKYIIDNIPSPIDFECNNDIAKRTLQNAKNLIMCRMGEVPYDRMRGLNPALFDLPIVDVNSQLMPEIDRVMAYEPDVKAVSAAATQDQNGEIVITVVLEVNL